MSQFYFQNFTPQIYYDFTGGSDPHVITDITKRFIILNIVRKYGTIYYTHYVQDGQRPDTVAELYYQNSNLDWVILMTNWIQDPFFDWPLDYTSFKSFIKAKYGSIPNAYQTVHHYEWIVQQASRLVDGTNIPQRTLIIDETAYNAITDEFARNVVSCYDYERILNDSKKTIRVIHPTYVQQILSEVETIFS